MTEQEIGTTVIRTSGQRAECMEWRLVLQAAGIPVTTRHRRGDWMLVVNANDADRAETELDDYLAENGSRQTRVVMKSPRHPGAIPGVVVYAVTVISIAACTLPWAFAIDLFDPGQMQAGLVAGGEWWRCVTALTLHVDEGHLASNLLFGVLFGFLAGRMLGGGIAWLSILVAGALGNLANGIIQQPDHTSVGASTAVFAALGILVAGALKKRGPANATVRESLARRWSPLIGGVALLAMIGVGDGTGRIDVMAHMTGFVAGLFTGWLGARLPSSWLARGQFQLFAGAVAVAIVMLCWAIALASAAS